MDPTSASAGDWWSSPAFFYEQICKFAGGLLAELLIIHCLPFSIGAQVINC
jgi:hypothetical protein